jgi:pimeloyl-ACP methyl ester carboxylesterase
MKEANPFLTDEIAQHLTLHGTNWNADGSIIWKFDNYARVFPPYGTDREDAIEVLGRVTCPSLLFWGRQSFAKDPETDPLAQVIQNRRVVKVDPPGTGCITTSSVFWWETKKF